MRAPRCHALLPAVSQLRNRIIGAIATARMAGSCRGPLFYGPCSDGGRVGARLPAPNTSWTAMCPLVLATMRGWQDSTGNRSMLILHVQDDPSLVEAAVADLQAVLDRDPACDSYVKPLLFFKGFQVCAALLMTWACVCGVV